MGVGVSGWRLARAVSLTGQLGVVSGVALDTLLARRLQLGDPKGDIRRAFASFPYPEVAEQILERYFIEGGIDEAQPFRLVPRLSLDPSRLRPTSSSWRTSSRSSSPSRAMTASSGSITSKRSKWPRRLPPMGPCSPVWTSFLSVRASGRIAGAVEFPRCRPGRRDSCRRDRRGRREIHRWRAPESSRWWRRQLNRPRFLAIVASHVLASYLAATSALDLRLRRRRACRRWPQRPAPRSGEL